MSYPRMSMVYVAGPFRAPNTWEIEQNIRRAEELALEVWKLGAACLCPHTNTRFYQGAADDSVWLNGDIEMMRRCDAVIFLPGWKASSGSCEERAFCVKVGIPVFDSLSHLGTWLEDSYAPMDKTQ